MNMYTTKVIDGQITALENIKFKKKLARVRESMEKAAEKRRANNQKGA